MASQIKSVNGGTGVRMADAEAAKVLAIINKALEALDAK